MSPLPSNWYFGGRNDLEGQQNQNPFGGFNLGGVQSAPSAPVPPAPPSAGVAGSAPGQPPPTGGMAIGQDPMNAGPSSTPGSSETAPAPPGEGPTVDAAFNASQPGTLPGTVRGFAPVTDFTQESSLSPFSNALGLSNLASAGMKVAMGLNPANLVSPMMNTVTNQAGGRLGGFNIDPTTGLQVNSPDFATIRGLDPSFYTGTQVPGVPGVTPAIEAQSPFAPYTGTVGTAPAGVANTTDFGARPQVDQPDVGKGPDPDASGVNGGAGVAGTPGVAASGIGPGTGTAPTGDVGTPGGPGGAPGGDAGGDAGGAGGAYKKGGRVRGQRPDPRMLAAKLRQGAKVDVGDPRATGDNVKRVDLQTGEEVMNRPAARAHAAQLEAWNRTGRRTMGQGGMAVGAPRDQRR